LNRFGYGFIAGCLLVVLLGFWRDNVKTINPEDLVKSYEKGFQDALNAEKPSERLEYVCAALWLKGNEK